MSDLAPGLYETILTNDLKRRTDHLSSSLAAQFRKLEPSEVPDRIALLLRREIERAIADIPEGDRVDVAIAAAELLLQQLSSFLGAEIGDLPVAPGTVLRAVLGRRVDGRFQEVDEPLTPLLDTTLLTNAHGEPNLWNQLRSEVASADSIDLVMAFIRRSGLAPLLESLRRHCLDGRRLRVLTTTYTGSTERRALDDLAELGAEVRVSYDLSTTRLHAKAWAFHRHSGHSTAYVGSSNLTHSAQATGLEWNVRLSEARNPDVVAKFNAIFESYWSGEEFQPYDPNQFDAEVALSRREGGPITVLSPLEIHPLPFQHRLLELLEVSRLRGYHRNLLVAATGTGKTVMAALDYANLRSQLSRTRLLFVAHRQELLDQSIATFRQALRDPTFGEQWVGGRRPSRFDHVFASIQSLAAADLAALAPDYFDVVIVDEFHHAAAASYQRVLERLEPIELLGLTATPERSDGLPILHWFGDRIAAELRLWDAIDQQHLVPFLYFGIHDGVDLRDVPWRRGQGYDVEALNRIYTSSDAWARLVVDQVDQHVDVNRMRCLGFCVSIQHAEFMAAHFNRQGIPAVAISGESRRTERESALYKLAAGEVRAVFSVDLFNEGIDVPAVDTLLMLRPTESPTLFLQQLGRGLRHATNKPHCTVLDFVGTHRRQFRFDRRFRSLLGGSRRAIVRAVEQQFPYLPAGCSMQLDRLASDVILRSLRDAVPTQGPALAEELRTLARERSDVRLTNFLEESFLDLDDIYGNSRSWSDLRQAAGLSVSPPGPHEVAYRRAIGRLLHIDDEERLAKYRELLALPSAPNPMTMSDRQRRLVRMLLAQVEGRTAKATFDEALDLLWDHPQVVAELRELFEVLEERVDHVHHPLKSHPDVPLQVHARYSRIEILSAMDIGDGVATTQWQSGVFEAKQERAELLAFTLDKSSRGFSPTTRYRDYAISRSLIHWESQNAVRADSATGLRYRHHERDNRSILLFARHDASDRAFWFLGRGQYRGHTGERPMAITWELETPLPGDLYADFSAIA